MANHYICMSLCGHVGMSACQRNSSYYSVMGIGTSVHQHGDNISTDMPSSHHAVMPSSVLIFTHSKKLSIIIIGIHVNMHRISFLGGLSLHLNHLIASRMANYDWPFGTLPFGLFGSNLDTSDLETYARTYSGHF